jgi:hypothetical protein
VNDATAVIDMRTPATAPLPIISARPASHVRRAPARRRPRPGLVELAAHAAGWGTLAVMLVRWATTLPVV